MAQLQAVRGTLHPQSSGFTQLTTYFDPHSQIAWGYMHAEPRPCFTPTLLRELLAWGNGLVDAIDDPARTAAKYFVVASRVPEIFSLGGDLDLFMRLIEARDREALYHYAIACIDCSYAVHSHLNVLIAERGAKMGLPEILFNLFPGMGAMSFLGRRVGHHLAEKIIRSGKVYLAEELYEMGVVTSSCVGKKNPATACSRCVPRGRSASPCPTTNWCALPKSGSTRRCGCSPRICA